MNYLKVFCKTVGISAASRRIALVYHFVKTKKQDILLFFFVCLNVRTLKEDLKSGPVTVNS